MKTTPLLSVLILACCLLGFTSTTLYAQAYQFPGTPVTPINEPSNLDVGTITNNTGTVTTIDGAVLFYNPATDGPSLTVKASLTDDNGNAFSSYKWYNMTVSGGTETEIEITGETTESLIRSELFPGYHKFRVYGLGGEAACLSDDYEDIILFVLSPLTVTSEYDLNGNTGLTYCADNVPGAASAVQLSTSSITADYSSNTNGYTHPLAQDFELTYAWFAVLDGDTANPISLGTTETTAMTLPGVGSYTFYVEVEYTIKDKGSRAYVTYRSNLTNTDDTAVEIVVTPTPGNPTITIEGVTD